MADEARLHEILDIAEQAKAEGDQKTFDEMMAMYDAESAGAPADVAAPAAQSAGQARGAEGKAIGEAALSALTGIGSTIAGGIAGAASTLIPGVDSADMVRAVQEKYTYQPRSKAGRDIVDMASVPFDLMAKMGQKSNELEGPLSGFYRSAGIPDEMRQSGPIESTIQQTMTEGAANLIGRVPNAPKPRVTNPQVDLLRREGIRVDRAQDGGVIAKSAKRASDMILGPDDAYAAGQSAELNRALLKRAGFEGDTLDVGKRIEMDNVIGAKYDDLTSRVHTPLDAKLDAKLAEIEADAVATLGADDLAPIKAQIKNIREKGASGEIIGEAAQKIRQRITALAKDQTKGSIAQDLKGALDEAYERHASPEDAAKMREARRQWRIYIQIEKMMGDNATGNVSPAKLYNTVDDKKNRGSGLLDLAEAAKNVLPDKTPNSGTPSRLMDIGRIAALVNPKTMLPAAAIGGLAYGARVLNRMPRNAPGPRAITQQPVGAVVSGSGEAMLQEQRDRINAYLQAIGAR